MLGFENHLKDFGSHCSADASNHISNEKQNHWVLNPEGPRYMSHASHSSHLSMLGLTYLYTQSTSREGT